MESALRDTGKNYKLDLNIFNLPGQTTSDTAYACNYTYNSQLTAINPNGVLEVIRHPT